jgi:hypothetical protein
MDGAFRFRFLSPTCCHTAAGARMASKGFGLV